MEQLTNSRIRAFRRCARLHYFLYEIRRKRLKMNDAIGFGTLFHRGLEGWWKAAKNSVPGDEWLSVAIAMMEDCSEEIAQECDLDPFGLLKADQLMRGYHARWLPAMADFKVLGVESEFDAEMINPHTGHSSKTYTIAGKLDARVLIKSLGRVAIVEHKTTTLDIEPGSDYWQRLRMDSQVSTYHDGAAALGEFPASCIYDVCKRPTLRPHKATPEEDRKYTTKTSRLQDGTLRPAGSLYAGQREHDETLGEYRDRLAKHIADNPDAYFQRGEVVRLESEMTEFRLDLWHTARALRERQLVGRTAGIRAWPRNPDACDRWGHKCDYWDVCTGAASIEDDNLFRTAKNQHEELTSSPECRKIAGT